MRSSGAAKFLLLLFVAAISSACLLRSSDAESQRSLVDRVALPSVGFQIIYEWREEGVNGAFVWSQANGMRRYDASPDGFGDPVSGSFRIQHELRADSNLPVSFYDCTWRRTDNLNATMDCSDFVDLYIIHELDAVVLSGTLSGFKGERMIAGEKARCYTVVASIGDIAGEVCIGTETAAPLAVSLENPARPGVRSELEAKSIEAFSGTLLPPTLLPLVPDSGRAPARSLSELYLPEAFDPQ